MKIFEQGNDIGIRHFPDVSTSDDLEKETGKVVLKIVKSGVL